jgi:hypothetical protein
MAASYGFLEKIILRVLLPLAQADASGKSGHAFGIYFGL